MKKIINGNWRIIISIFCAAVILFSASAPSVSATVNQDAELQSEEKLSKEEMDKIIQETAHEINLEAPRVDNGEFTTMAGGTLLLKLTKHFGKSYVKSKLPKKIYKAFPKALKSDVSEAKWVGIWNTYILMGPLDEVKTNVANSLKPYVWDWVATSCGYIAQGIVYAII
ncbi:hypothetical protein [Halobacillus sp. Marseille-P3879]|uniref:hypothetical protein n=1 Tax=Halobacillus sp. Marseille-P3879 TaxID=2045014 RepID=UPI000C7A18E0|nr:hypothetical protein [Halobacillus sp. Marseille-P3879]